MKKRKKQIANLLKLGVFLFGVSLLLSSCESDEISSLPEQHSSTTNFKITTLNSEQISKNEKVKEILKKSKKYEKNLKAKSVANYQDFYIDTSFSKYVESSDGTQHSYTFLIDRNNNTLENLLLSSNNQGGYNTYIVSYGFSSQEKSNMNFNDFSSKEVIIKPIDFDTSQIINTQAKTQQLVCIDSQTQVKVGCCGGDLCRGESSDCIINGGTGYYYEWVTTSSTCEWIAPGGDNDSSSTTDGEPTSTSGGDSSTTTVLIDTTPYTTDLKQFVSGTLNLATEGVKSYYTSNSNIYNTINNYLIQKGFSDFSKFEAMLNLEFGFSLGLNPQSFVWAFNNKESEEVKAVKDFLRANNNFSEAQSFTKEITDIISLESNVDNNALSFVFEAFNQNKISNELDHSFLESVNQYMDVDISSMENTDPIVQHFIFKMATLRALNPNWSKTKVFWEATKDVVHISLDVFGLVPVVGEIADLTNGALYAIEGDGVNATLSFASAIPVVGYGSVATKYGLKIVKASTIGTRVKLVWKITANGVEFGSRGTLRKVLGITDSALQAHHIMPWAESIRNHNIIQKAANSKHAFHMNEALNGIAVASWRNQPNHPTYTNLVKSKLDNFLSLNPNATVDEAYNFVSDLIGDIRDWVISNPNSHLNDLVLP
ncbi:AHH domain-containing protein [Tenacibaculum sp. IMCC1]